VARGEGSLFVDELGVDEGLTTLPCDVVAGRDQNARLSYQQGQDSKIHNIHKTPRGIRVMDRQLIGANGAQVA
jgi:hypothetical protein